MENFSQWLTTIKAEEADNIARTAKNYFLDKIPFSFSVRVLNENDLDEVLALQKEIAKKATLRQNNKEEFIESLKNGVWIGIFDENQQLEAYTVFELEFLDNNILLYLKATVKREERLKGFQKQTLELRKKLGGNLAEKSMIPFGGGYATCHPENVRCTNNLTSSGMYRLFHVKALYGDSPKGDRDIYGYGDIFDLKDLLFEKWDALEIEG